MVIYISPTKLKRETLLGEQVDENIINPCIRMAQERYILPILGTQLREKIDTEIAAGSLSGIYQTIVDDYIQNALVYYSFCEVAVALRLRFSNNSITIPTSEQGDVANPDDIKFVLDRYRHMADFYAQRLIDYLFDENSSIPEMSTNQWPDIYPTRRNYNGGLNLYQAYPLPNQIKAWLQAIGAKYLTYR